MQPSFEIGRVVRLIRNVRNDGTFPGLEIGDLLVRRGSLGHVQSVGTFLQDQIIYSVHFLEEDKMVGCREEELIGDDEPWVPSRFEFRDKVQNKMALAINGEVIVEKNSEGEVLKVLRDNPDNVQYHVRFPGRTLQVPESALDLIPRVEEGVNESVCDDGA
jgi:nitrogen fixation protein NifZ